MFNLNLNTIVVGQYALTPEQLQSAGFLKPGSAQVIQSLVNQGVPLANAMPSSLFTGKSGVKNLPSLAENVTAQAAAVTTNLQTAQTALTNAGIISGNESPTAIAGVVKAGATVGIDQTIAAVKGSASGLSSAVTSAAKGPLSSALGGATSAGAAIKAGLSNATGSLAGAKDSALKAIGSGNMAGQLADGVTSGLGSIKDSLAGLAESKGLSSAIDQAAGVAASAFNAIKDSFPTMPAGVPVDVEQVAKQAAAKAESAAAAITGASTNIQSAIKNPGSAVTNAVQSATAGIQNTLSGGAAALGKKLPGVAASASSITQNATQKLASALPALPKVEDVIKATGGNPISRTIEGDSITGTGALF